MDTIGVHLQLKQLSLFQTTLYFFSVFPPFLVVSISATDCLERLVSKETMTYTASSSILPILLSLPSSVFLLLFLTPVLTQDISFVL